MHLQNIHTINKLYSAVKYIFNVVHNMHIDQDIPLKIIIELEFPFLFLTLLISLKNIIYGI